MLTVAELILKIHADSGAFTNPGTVSGWITRGVSGIVLPHERQGGKVRIRWSDYKKWQKQVKEAKSKGPRGGRQPVGMV